MNSHIKIIREKVKEEERMKEGNITLQDLRGFAESINNEQLETLTRHKRFTFSLDHRGFHYIPESSGKPRIQENRYIERVLERFNQIWSMSPKDYQDISKNASYLLAVIKKYRNA
jgi:hypothetical protein